MTPRVEFRGWGWRYPGRKAWSVRHLDLVLEPGERVLLLGASGAGKSTLLAGIAGLLDDQRSGESEGALLLDGVPARAARIDAVRSGRARTGLLLQDPLAQTVLARCGDDVAFGLENHGVTDIWPRVDDALGRVGFPYGREHPTAALSGGERQRLALAGVLALRPGLLLLDEPTAMLDPAGGDLVRSAVGAALGPGGLGCLVVEHRVEPWLPLVDRVVVIGPDGVLADGTPDDVFAAAAGPLAAAGIWTPGLAARLAAEATRRSSSGGEPLLVADGVTVTRPVPGTTGRRAPRRPVLTGVSFTLRRGRATGLTGPNGAGKSTLALAVAGLEPVAAGSLAAAPALARGLDPAPARWHGRELIARIGSVFQDPQHQFVAGTVREELEVGPRVLGRTAPVDDLLERLRLAPLARANPFTLSGGEKRRLSVATALATAPDLLVLDEPTFGQDAGTWAELTRLLGDLLDGGAGLLVATHDRDLMTALGDDAGVRL